MPFTIPELIEDLPELAALVEKIQAGIAAIPPVPVPPPAGGAPVTPYATLFASVLPELGALVDTIKTQAAN